MAIDTPARHIYSGDGSTRVFPIPTYIQGDDYIRIEINGVYQVDRSKWDIVNNSIIFVTAPITAATIDVQVATSVEALSELGSITNVDIVAGINDKIIIVADNLDIIENGYSISEMNEHMVNINNPHGVTKEQVGLSNVENLSPANMPISTATATALGSITTALGDITTDVTTLETLTNSHINLSGITAYHLLQGNLAVSASTITQGFNTTLYTSGSATTNIDMNTQWGNTAEEKFGGLVWLKDRVEATNHFFYDTVRGATKEINSNTTEVEATLAGGLTAFNSTGFTVEADVGHNSTTNNMYSANFQTTHRVTGTTNHGKAYTCHFNPFTGFTIVKYEGSGIAGHEIPHMLGRKLGFITTKNLSVVGNWVSQYSDNNYLYLNTTAAILANTTAGTFNESNVSFGTTPESNGSTNQHIMYGWANSYLDESNKLIGNYELVPYQGTGTAGNKVKTKGKPAWIMIKRVDSTGEWVIFDNQRGLGLGINAKYLLAHSSAAETSLAANDMSFTSDGFIVGNTGIAVNASGGTYITLVAYDTNSNGGGSYYPLASDTANVQINNALIPLAQGIDSNGAKNTILSKNETITGLTYTQGKNYLYKTDTGYGVKPYEPRMLSSELVRRFAGEQPDYYDVASNKWFNTDAGSELVTNGKFSVNTSGWTAVNATLGIDNGRMKVTNTIAAAGYAYQALTFVVGKKYRIKATAHYGTAPSFISLYETAGDPATSNNTIAYTASGAVSGYIDFIAQQTTYYISVRVNAATAGAYAFIDDISVFKTDIVPTTEITNSRNYLNHIVHADNDGEVLYVEELPKIEYKDIVKANEFKGKNACTAWANIDMTTTPPTIRDSYNVSSVIRISAGIGEGYFLTPMDNSNYGGVVNGATNASVFGYGGVSPINLNKFSFSVSQGSTMTNAPYVFIEIKGGKN